MVKVTFNGLDALRKKLSDIKNMEAAKQVVKTNGAELHRRMVSKAVFTRGYSTGQTRRSITTDISDGGMTSTTKPNTDYAAYLEYGTRKMSAQPFVGPAFNEQKEQFKQDLERLVK